MRIKIEGEVSTKLQLFSSKLKGWLHAIFRATYVRQVRGFAYSKEFPSGEFRYTQPIPGPVDVTVAGSLAGTTLAVDYTVHPDGVMLPLYHGEFHFDTRVEKRFKVSVSGNTIEGTIRIEQ